MQEKKQETKKYHSCTYPMGWPSETAPPWILTLDGSRSHNLMLAKTTTEKASLTSHIATSSDFTPVISSSWNEWQVTFRWWSSLSHQRYMWEKYGAKAVSIILITTEIATLSNPLTAYQEFHYQWTDTFNWISAH